MIKVVTDSTANLPPETLEEYPSISVIPSYVTFRNQTLRESIDLTTSEFYTRLAEERELPSTNQASVLDFTDFYQQILSDNPQAAIISIHIAGVLSGTVESARQAAARFPSADIHVFDSCSISLGHGLMVRQAAYMVRVGFSVKEIIAQLTSMKSSMRMFFVLDNLHYLFKGGRIGVAAHIMGSALDIKPILTIQDGSVVPHEKHRSRAQAVNAMKELLIAEGRDKHGLQVAVVYSVCKDEAQQLAEQIRVSLSPDVLLVGELGPAIGVYSGPGALGLCWWVPQQ